MPSNNNKLIIITAPSGAGKTSITRHLLNSFPQKLVFSVSATTRPKRDYETEGLHYHFMSTEDFMQKLDNDEFVEWEMVYEGKYYGTLRSELEHAWQQGKVPLLDIDVQGAVHVQQRYPEHTLSLFIEPPSIDELRRRLESRGSETPESIRTRVSKAAFELSFKPHFHKVVMNDDLDKACREAGEMVKNFLEE